LPRDLPLAQSRELPKEQEISIARIVSFGVSCIVGDSNRNYLASDEVNPDSTTSLTEHDSAQIVHVSRETIHAVDDDSVPSRA
jgi:hypothetical protein